MSRVGLVGVGLVAVFVCAAPVTRAQIAPGCPSPPSDDRIITSPPNGAFGVALDSPVVVRVHGDPAPELHLWQLVAAADAGVPDSGLPELPRSLPVSATWQRLGESDVFVVRPTELFQPETEYEIEVYNNATGLQTFRTFTTGTSIDRQPPEFTFGPDVVDDLASSKIAAVCGEPEGSYNVSFSLAEATDDGDEGGIEFLAYLTRAAGLNGPVLLTRQYQSEGRSLAFTLTAEQVSTPVCVVVDAVDAVGNHAPEEDIQELCFDPLQGSFFEPCAVSARDLTVHGGVIAWMLAALLALRVRAVRLRTR